MPLPEEQSNKFKEWMRQKQIERLCDSCGMSSWIIGDMVAVPTISGNQVNALNGPFVPMLQLICNDCGYVRHYAAVKVGLAS